MAKWESAPLASTPAQGAPKWQSAPLASPSAPPEANNGYFSDLPAPGNVTPAAPAAPQTDFNETAFAQGTSGVNEGIANVLGLPVDATQGLLRLGAAGINAATGSDIQLPIDAIGGSQSIKAAMAPAIRPESADSGNQMIRRVGEEVGAALVPGMGVVAKAAAPLRSAAAQGAVALGSGGAAAVAQQVAPDNPMAELAAQILGGGVVAGGSRALQKAVTPFPIQAERQAMNDIMAREGVELTPGQQTGNKGLQYAESELGGGRIANLTEQQAEQFTRAALSRAGISAPRATPEVMDRAFNDLGAQFDGLATRNYVAPDAQLGQDLGAVVQEYNSLVPETSRAPIIEGVLNDVVRAIQTGPIPGAGPRAVTAGPVNGVISGESYQALRSRLNRMARKSTDPELQDALFGIQSALDDAMERTLQQVNPEDLGAWRQVRGDYRNLIALEQSVSRAGENAAMGIITPANLRSAVAQQGKRAYVRGQGDFADLARGGVATMTPLPQSGTAPRQFVRNAGMAFPALAGAGIGGAGGDAFGAMAGMAAGAAVPGALGRLMLSRPGRAYLTNQAWTSPQSLSAFATGPAIGAAAGQMNEQTNLERLRAQALN